MKKFLVLFLIPVGVMEDWMKKDAVERKAEEDKMGADWDTWTRDNKSHFVDAPTGAGKTKTITLEGITDTKNNIMMCATVEANSDDDAAALFVNHPHLQISQSSIEIMGLKSL